MREVGGYFELEKIGVEKAHYHNALALNSGRAALRFILQNGPIQKIYLPFFCCDTLIEPIVAEGCEYEFLRINDRFEYVEPPVLKEQESLLVINYFGLKDSYIHSLVKQYGHQLIVDNTQSFFTKGYDECCSFNSTRKYFGVVDGSYLYYPFANSSVSATLPRNQIYCAEHLYLRLQSDAEKGYQDYCYNESLIDSVPKLMSAFSQFYLRRIDYDEVQIKRKANFEIAQQYFSKYNSLDASAGANGLFYPLVLSNGVDKRIFHENKIYISTIWPDVIKRKNAEFAFETELVNRIIPIPIDHRYTANDCNHYCKRILNLLNLNQ